MQHNDDEVQAIEKAHYEEISIGKSLSFTIGYNKSDATYGWNGAKSSFTVFYVHYPLEYTFSEMDEYSHSLVTGVIPQVTFQLRTVKYLNSPFTKCDPTAGYIQRIELGNVVSLNIVVTCKSVMTTLVRVK